MTTNAPFTSLRLVQLDHLIENATEEAYKDLQNIASSLPNQTDDAKKRALLQHLNATKQRLLRLQVLLQWCHKASAVAECKRVLEVSSTHANAFREAADQLVYLHGELVYSKAPAYDIPTAMHVLGSGGYNALPTLIESELKVVAPGKKGKNSKVAASGASGEKETTTATPEQVERGKAALKRIDFLIRSKLLEEGVPHGMRIERISNGEAVVSSTTQQYTATISLVPAPSTEATLAKWTPPEEGIATLLPGASPEQQNAEAVKMEDQEIVQPIKQEENFTGANGKTEKEEEEEKEQQIKAEAMDIDRDATTTTIKKLPSLSVSEASLWRWRLISFQLLPTHPSALLPPHLVPWLIRNVEDRMWAASDIQQLMKLGKADLVVVPPPPLNRKEREKKQKEIDEKGRDSTVPLSLSLSQSFSLGGGGGGVSAQPSKSSGSLLPGVSGAGALSGAGSEQVGAAATATATATASAAGKDGREAGEPGVIPIWAQSPLAALHAVLQHTSAKLAIGSVLMEQARALESGSSTSTGDVSGVAGAWSNGNLRLSKLDDRFGVKFTLWPRVPLLSTSELSSILHQGERDDDAKEEEKVKKERKNKAEKYPSLGWTLQVEVPPPSYEKKITEKSSREKSSKPEKENISSTSEGTITCVCVPPLQRGISSEGTTVPPPSVWSDDGSLSTENLLLCASAQHAEVQLLAVQRLIAEAQHAQHAHHLDEVLGVGTWQIDLVDTQSSTTSHAMPALQCTFYNHAVLLLHFRLTDGHPIFSLGPNLTESGVELASEAQNLVNKAQNALNRRLEAVLTEVLPTGITRSRLWATTISEAVLEAWKQLVALERKEHVLQEGLGYGFGRAVLPRCLESVELAPGANAADGAAAVGASKEITAVLRAPYFTSPTLSSPLKESISMEKQGSLVCILLADVASAAAVTSTENFGKQLKLALCWATPRGVPTALRRLVSVPLEVILKPGNQINDGGGASGGNSRGAASTSAKRKRHAMDNEDEGNINNVNTKNNETITGATTTAISDESKRLSPAPLEIAVNNINWDQLKHWCLSIIAVHQIEAQLEAADCKAEPTEDKTTVRVLLKNLPWLSSSSSVSSPFLLFTDEEIQFSLDPGQEATTHPEKGAFLTSFIGPKFSLWRKEIEKFGLQNLIHIGGINKNDADARGESGATGQGNSNISNSKSNTVTVRCCLEDGKWSASHMVAKAVCISATTECVINLATALKKQEKEEERKNRYSVIIESIDLDTIYLTHVDSGGSGSDAISIAIQWSATTTNKNVGGSNVASGVSGSAGGSSVRRLMTTDSTLIQKPTSLESKERGSIITSSANSAALVCSISTSPPLPLPLLSYLEAQLSVENGCEMTSFLSVVTNVAASAAVVQAAVLDLAAQHAAGLIPGAVTVESFSFGPTPTAAAAASASAGGLGVCRVLIHQLGRSLQLQLEFQNSGAVVLYARQLPPTREAQQPDAASTAATNGGGEDVWLKGAWSRILESQNGASISVSSDKSTEEWSHVSALLLPEELGSVLTSLMQAVSRKFS